MVTVNGITITNETIMKTRSHYINNCNACILQADSGIFRVNDLMKHREWQKRWIRHIANGESDHTLAFLQHALWLQTGKMEAILP